MYVDCGEMIICTPICVDNNIIICSGEMTILYSQRAIS